MSERNSILLNMLSTWKCVIVAVMCLGSVLSQSDSNLDDDKLWYPVAYRYTELSDGDYYYFHNEALTWVQAAQFCAAEGSHLLILNSAEEAELVKKVITNNTDFYRYTWLGFHDMFAEGKFITINDKTLEEAGYAEWEEGQPSGYAADGIVKEDCGSLYPNGKLNDESCDRSMNFVCEHVPKSVANICIK